MQPWAASHPHERVAMVTAMTGCGSFQSIEKNPVHFSKFSAFTSLRLCDSLMVSPCYEGLFARSRDDAALIDLLSRFLQK